MNNLIHTAVVTLFAASTAQAQQAVQWKVSDGGNGHWYARIDNGSIINWRTAKASAEAMGGYLACIAGVAENDWIWSTLVQPASAGWDAWFGLFQQPGSTEPYGGWTWISGEPLTFTSWCGNQPDDSNGSEDFGHYMTLHGPGCWNDIRENGSYSGVFHIHDYIVEWSADCNGDGIVDYGQCHDGTLQDYDGDNIPDCCERGETCAVGDYPLQWKVSEGGNGHWYAARNDSQIQNWNQAKIDAEMAGGHLAAVTSAAESEFIWSRLASKVSTWRHVGNWSGAALGGYLEPSGWKWVTGEPWGYSNWGTCYNQQGEQRIAYGCDTYGNAWNDITDSDVNIGGSIAEWDTDCNRDSIVDYGQILRGELPDTNGNGIPDCCENGGTCCIGDIFRDGQINGGDLGIMLSYWGAVTSSSASRACDLNHDDRVDGSDLGLLLANWGTCPG